MHIYAVAHVLLQLRTMLQTAVIRLDEAAVRVAINTRHQRRQEITRRDLVRVCDNKERLSDYIRQRVVEITRLETLSVFASHYLYVFKTWRESIDLAHDLTVAAVVQDIHTIDSGSMPLATGNSAHLERAVSASSDQRAT